jgi:Na+/proline symporter
MLGAMRDRRAIIEFALLMILLTVLGGVARSVLPDVHQLLRFALVVAVTVAVWVTARALHRQVQRRDRAG